MKGDDDLALTKRTYIDDVTVIPAKNLNEIQDEIIEQGEILETLRAQIAPTDDLVNAQIEE